MDEVVRLECLFTSSFYDLPDPQFEFQCNGRISFQDFVGLGAPLVGWPSAPTRLLDRGRRAPASSENGGGES